MLKEKIKKDLICALKEKKELEVSVLRLLLNSISNKEREKRYNLIKNNPQLKKEDLEKKSQLEDEEIIDVIFSELKKRKDAILELEKSDRKELLEKEKKEIKILEKYLPERLSEKEIEKLAKEIIEKVGAESLKDMGKVMKELIPKVKGKAEGKLVSEIVRKILTS